MDGSLLPGGACLTDSWPVRFMFMLFLRHTQVRLYAYISHLWSVIVTFIQYQSSEKLVSLYIFRNNNASGNMSSTRDLSRVLRTRRREIFYCQKPKLGIVQLSHVTVYGRCCRDVNTPEGVWFQDIFNVLLSRRAGTFAFYAAELFATLLGNFLLKSSICHGRLQTVDIPRLKIYHSRKREGDLMQAYCVKCRTKREMRNPKVITMKNGRPATQDICPACHTKIFRIGKSHLVKD